MVCGIIIPKKNAHASDLWFLNSQKHAPVNLGLTNIYECLGYSTTEPLIYKSVYQIHAENLPSEGCCQRQ